MEEFSYCSDERGDNVLTHFNTRETCISSSLEFLFETMMGKTAPEGHACNCWFERHFDVVFTEGCNNDMNINYWLYATQHDTAGRWQ